MSAVNKVKIWRDVDSNPRSFYLEKDEYRKIYPDRMARRMPIVFHRSIGNAIEVEPEIADYLIANYRGIELFSEHIKPKEQEPVITTEQLIDECIKLKNEITQDEKKIRFLELKDRGWVKLTNEQKAEYQALKKELYD